MHAYSKKKKEMKKKEGKKTLEKKNVCPLQDEGNAK